MRGAFLQHRTPPWLLKEPGTEHEARGTEKEPRHNAWFACEKKGAWAGEDSDKAVDGGDEADSGPRDAAPKSEESCSGSHG